jgi:hypothetical protein
LVICRNRSGIPTGAGRSGSSPRGTSFERQPWTVPDSHEIYITKSFGKRVQVPVPKLTEGHGGGDDRLRDLIFRNISVPDYMKLPDSHAGAMSCLTGIAVRNSIDQKKPIRIADLVRL